MTRYDMEKPLLVVSNLTVKHQGRAGVSIILDDVSLQLQRGEILGLIGESGAGKSTLGNIILGSSAPDFKRTSGTVRLEGLFEYGKEELGAVIAPSRRISAIFQDHTASLDPLMTVGAQIEETILAQSGLSREQVRRHATELLKRVGIESPEERHHHYPHQFSGGQRQRIVIAIALAATPDIIIADEPTSALDATVQKQILALLRGLVDETGVSIVLVTHDMGVVAEVADRVIVMRHGKIVEQGLTVDILESPQESYTRSLLSAVPILRIVESKERNDTLQASHGVVANTIKNSAGEDRPILWAQGVTKIFSGRELPWLRSSANKPALEDVSIKMTEGEITGIVGESGSGKSTIGRIVAGLETAHKGRLEIEGRDYNLAVPGRRSGLLGRVQMIFQDPSAALNPRMTIGATLHESLRFGGAGAGEPREDVAAMVDRLGLAPSLLGRYPHQLSGGQKQRVCIARALLANPRTIVADEPTSALDVSVQAEIVNLLREVVTDRKISMLFISHDLALVQELCGSLYIFKDGKVVDEGAAEYIFARSRNQYTRSLIDARPKRFTR